MQRDDAWYAGRLGKLTASRFHEAIAKTKSGWGASRANYIADLVCERLTAVRIERYVSKEMLWGIETEEQARSAYEYLTDQTVELVDFADHPTIAMSGASPDGSIGADGLVEIKCPNTATHIDTLLGEPLERKYLIQIMWQLACTGRQWCDFVSFDPRMPEAMRFHCQRIKRDDEVIAGLEKEAVAFLKEVESKVNMLRLHYEPQSAAA